VNKTGSVRIIVILRHVSCNHCFLGKAVGVTYSDCVSVALGIAGHDEDNSLFRNLANVPNKAK
jgi:hypothetical protein